MDPILEFLKSREAIAARRRLARPPGEPPVDPLAVAAELRRAMSPERARALAEQIELERRAWVKFEDPRALLFERTALEQASSLAVARFHAEAILPGASVLDLGCGLAADAMAFARTGHPTVAVERDRGRLAIAAHNLATLAGTRCPEAGGAVRFVMVAGEAAAPPARADFLYVDPDRRPGTRRVARLAETSPSLAAVLALRDRFAGVLVKAPPALPDEEIPGDASVAFLSEKGIAKEAFLRLGEGAGAGTRTAVLLDSGLVREVEAGPPAPVRERGDWLHDPDPALRRAGGVDALALEIQAGRAAPGVTYLLGDRDVRTPWARTYRVLEAFPYRARDLARRLTADPPRELIVKQRGLAIPEERIRRGIPFRGGGPVRVVVLHPDGPSRRCLLCEPAPPAPAGPTDPRD